MKEFEKWIRGQDQLPVLRCERSEQLSFPRYGTVDEDSAAKDG